MEFLSFPEARKFVHSLKLKSQSEWRRYAKLRKKPANIPYNPDTHYRKEWKDWGDWLGTGRIADQNKEFLNFETARRFVRNLKLTSQRDWRRYCSSGKKPGNIPANPAKSYKDKWKGFGDWLGTGRIADQFRTYRAFEEARNYVRNLNLGSQDEWKLYIKSGNKPEDIPAAPWRTYKRNWKGFGDWLGTGTIASYNKKFRTFESSRSFVQMERIKSMSQWKRYVSSGRKPADIPSNPDHIYKKVWRGWGDFLGTGFIAYQNRNYLDFESAKKIAHGLKFRSGEEWRKYAKSEVKPPNIPADPAKMYAKEWKSMGDWLGTGTLAPKNKKFMSFHEAREYVQSLKLDGIEEWQEYIKLGKKPVEIPSNPDNYYKKDWRGWPDWFDYEERIWSVKKVKELLRDLIESNIIYSWDEAVLYSFLLRKGLLNLRARHGQFFRSLIEARKNPEGRRMLEEYSKSSSDNPPNLEAVIKQDVDNSVEIQTATNQDLITMAEDDPLNYQNDWSVEEILSQTSVLESINVDEEAMEFYLDYSVDELWRCAFKSENETVRKVQQEGKNGNKYHDMVIDAFLNDYDGSRKIRIPPDYSFPYPPTLMQRYIAYKVRKLPYFGNFSGTGAGKTLSAILASRVIHSNLTVIVCPNDVVEQWKRNILDTFPNSNVISGKDAFYIQNSANQFQYAILNYDKFSQEDSPNLILNLVKQKIEFVILDEIHFTKIRNEEEVSIRRRNLDGLMTSIRRKNSNVKVLGLSATPVVNNLREGRSLLELISGKVYDDVAVRPTIPNAVTLYEKLSTISIRELPKYSIDIDTHSFDVVAQKPREITIRQLKRNPLAIEKFLTDARIPQIVKLIDGQTIIYTEYVEDIIQSLSTAINEAGYSYAFYTGFDRSGLTTFLQKKVQVLIASRPLSVGVDGIQHVCNRLIINTLPWTNAQYQQLIGRLVRKGQIRDVVHVYLVKASIGGYQYDDLKWKRIQFKRTLADCAVDGRLPERNLVTPQQAAMEAVRWLERLDRGEISTVVRRDLNVELTPVEIKKRVIRYGDFTILNNKINNENSGTTHSRILKDPKEWEEYHRQYREARKIWPIIPFEEIIKRISQLSPRLLIGDFGCGEAKILEKFGNRRVYSFDHVAINDSVTACDIKSVPLPDEAIDIVVFSLSLMGRNWQEYIKEAKRCLATNGYILIAETTKSLKGRLSTLKQVIEQYGFNIYSQEQKGVFTFIEARQL